jgi:hypothetical protein
MIISNNIDRMGQKDNFSDMMGSFFPIRNIKIIRSLLNDLLWISVRGIFPGIIIGSLFIQQLDSPVFLFLGQIAFWLNITAAFIISLFYLKKKAGVLILIILLFFFKVGRIFAGESSTFLLLYTLSLCCLFGVAGGLVLFHHSKIIYKQVTIFCWISIPLMLLQLIGAGEWTQFFRTDLPQTIGKIQCSTLFVDKDNIQILALQARPAGFCFANNFLSLIIMFALALHYGLRTSSKISLNDIGLCLIMVLAMAKICFLTFFIFVLWFLLFGSWKKKMRMVKVSVLFFFVIFLYAFMFPGVFEYNTSFSNIRLNFILRALDLNKSIGGNVFLRSVLDQINVSGDDINRIEQEHQRGEHESGYATIGKALKLLAVIICINFPLYFMSAKKFIVFYPGFKDLLILFILLLFLMPLITSFISGPVFWFIAGFSFIPIILFLDSVRFQITQKQYVEEVTIIPS